MTTDKQAVQRDQTQIALAQAQPAKEFAKEAVQQIQEAAQVSEEDSQLPAIGKHDDNTQQLSDVSGSGFTTAQYSVVNSTKRPAKPAKPPASGSQDTDIAQASQAQQHIEKPKQAAKHIE